MKNKKKSILICVIIIIAMIFIVSSHSPTVETQEENIKKLIENNSPTPKIKNEPTQEEKNPIAIESQYEESFNKITESYKKIEEEIKNLEEIKDELKNNKQESEKTDKEIKIYQEEIETYQEEIEKIKDELKELKKSKENKSSFPVPYVILIIINIGGIGILIFNPKKKHIKSKNKKYLDLTK